MRHPVAEYAVAVAALLAALALRWLLDPVLGETVPLVTLFGAVAAASWVGGYRPAIAVTLLGYLCGSYLFIEPRGRLDLDARDVVGLVAYLFTCAFIIAFGEAMRRARSDADARGEEQLLTARHLAAIVESSDDAIIAKSLDGVIQSWNDAAERLFGYSAAEAVGRHISLIIPPERLAEEEQIIASLRAGRRIDHFETERLRRDGRRILISLTVSPIRDAAGKVVGASKIARDVTERKRLEDNLRKLAADLSAADRRKNEFLATLAHELRNPLAPLGNMLEVVKRADGDRETLQRAREAMERQLGQLVRLVDDLLDLNRITHNRLELRRSRTDLSSVIQQAVEASRPFVDSAGHELWVSLPSAPTFLDADPVRLAQVFANLLNNSCKYTAMGGKIWLSAERRDDEVVVSVKDSGIGIPPDKLDGIFDMFFQVGPPGGEKGGLGIGLTLVKRLVEMHGGTIEARSAGEGRGSEFVVRLPVLVDAAEATAPRPTAAQKKPPSRRILVVDDYSDSAASLAMLLEITGNETYTAADGIEALEAFEKHRPGVVLLDIGLPKLSGHEVCRRLREHPHGKDLIVIALTGWGNEGDRRKSLEAGFDGHLVKPVDYNALMELLSSLAPTEKAS